MSPLFLSFSRTGKATTIIFFMQPDILMSVRARVPCTCRFIRIINRIIKRYIVGSTIFLFNAHMYTWIQYSRGISCFLKILLITQKIFCSPNILAWKPFAKVEILHQTKWPLPEWPTPVIFMGFFEIVFYFKNSF